MISKMKKTSIKHRLVSNFLYKIKNYYFLDASHQPEEEMSNLY